jgi:hypothetical protein
MSTVQGGQGNIVTNGLVLNLDAANPRSYPQPYNGTTWTDLSGNNRNGTLTNSPVYSSANGGSIAFNNTSSYCAFSGNTFNISPGTTGEFSLEIWVYPTGPYSPYTPDAFTTNLGGFFGQSYFNLTAGWGIGMNTTSGINNFAFQVRNFSTISQPTTSFTNNNWYHVVGTFTRNENTRLYVNGSLRASSSNTNIGNLNLTPSNNDASIGRTGVLPYYAGGNISSARIYTRPINPSEILQNFNATRARFGI